MARILLIEDGERIAIAAAKFLGRRTSERPGHEVTTVATLLGAFSALQAAKNTGVELGAVLLDGDLGHRKESEKPRLSVGEVIIEPDDRRDGASDARATLRAMAALGLSVPVIGYSNELLVPRIDNEQDKARIVADPTKSIALPDLVAVVDLAMSNTGQR